MQMSPYIFFNGECEAAFQFYEKALGATIESLRRHAGTPAEEHVPPEWRNKILHARMIVGDQVLLASDAPPGHYEAPKGYSVHLQMKDAGEAERIFDALSEGGNVQMPMQQTFWATRFGMVIDQFNIPWMVHCERPA